MKIIDVKKFVTFYVETDDPEFGGMYRRGETGGWERQMGESWESEYSNEDELEAEFQKFMCSNANVCGLPHGKDDK